MQARAAEGWKLLQIGTYTYTSTGPLQEGAVEIHGWIMANRASFEFVWILNAHRASRKSNRAYLMLGFLTPDQSDERCLRQLVLVGFVRLQIPGFPLLSPIAMKDERCLRLEVCNACRFLTLDKSQNDTKCVKCCLFQIYFILNFVSAV